MHDMSYTLELTIVYEPGDNAWVIASISGMPGVHSQGRTRDQARAKVLEALQLMLSPEPGGPGGPGGLGGPGGPGGPGEPGDSSEREQLRFTLAA
jgi:predicted RNase H-like HicB family nuclease